MKQRRDSLSKIAVLQDQLHKLSTWKLAALDRQRAELLEAQRKAIESIDHDAMTHRMLVGCTTRYLRAIDQQIDVLKAQHAAQTRLAREQATRTKLAERMVERAEDVYRAHEERVALSELIERAVAKATASSA